jgi:uncharacterized protein
MELFLYLLLAQAVIGAFDTLYHHELKVGLARCPGAATELRIHSVRAVLYAILFGGLAWYEWHGLWVYVLVAIVAAEVLLTLWDFVVEDRSRVLPSSERITHTVLAINGGAAFMLLALMLPEWLGQDSSLVFVNYGWLSWLLSLAAVGVALSGIRDALAAHKFPQLISANALYLGQHRRLLITGGTGFIGSALCRALLQGGHEVTLVSRNPLAAALQFAGKVRVVRRTAELDADEFFDAVINLAGAPVVGLPWTKNRKAVLRASRLNTTHDLLAFARRARSAPASWIQASAIGFYGTHADETVTEHSPQGQGFAAELCGEWEQLTEELGALGIRRVVLRFGLVFGSSGGSLPIMLLPFRIGFGSVMGSGDQHMAWIHLEDVLRLVAWSIRTEASGVINAVAPDCPDYRSFAREVGVVLHRPVLVRIPAPPMRMLLGEMASMVVEGPEIISQRLPMTDFKFNFPTLRSALIDLA